MVFLFLQEAEGFRLGEEILSAITEETDILFLCNPNNPTGTLTEKALLLEVAKRCEETGTWFCLDECFLPFLAEEEKLTMMSEIERFPHLLILRAFTKIYGMPGLRLGYAVSANTGLLRRMRQTLQPWNTSLPAQLAGIAALQDETYLSRTRQLLSQEKEFLQKALLAGLADKVYDSRANYLFFKGPEDLQERLLEKKVLIRSCSSYPGLSEGYFRIGIRTHAENEALLDRWRARL